MDGCYYSSSGMSVILNPNNFSDTENGTVIGTFSSSYPSSAFAISDWAIYPHLIAGGSSTAGSCDNWSYASSRPCLFCGGGDYERNKRYGLFYVSYDGVSSTNSSTGFRVIVLP